MNSFDYIVVGTGSAGCILANRLSEKNTVLALEAGGPEIPDMIQNPSTWYMAWGGDYDWKYFSVPQPALDGRSTFEPRGKIVGGSSQLNLMMYIRGHRSDYANWAYNGALGWDYESLVPYFKKLEGQEDKTNPTTGTDGPFFIANAGLHDPNPTSSAFIEACEELGYPRTDDFNGPNMMGAGWHHINVKNGKRESLATAYIHPIQDRANLNLATGATVTKLLIENGKCVGVRYVQNGETKEARCNKEVVLAAGAMGSPHLLLLSGVGPAAQLSEHGVPVVADLPGVGENFQNHVLTGVTFECKKDIPPPQQNMSEAAMYCASTPGMIGPDLQMGCVQAAFDIIIGQAYPNCITIVPGLTRPYSRGWIRLASADPMVAPLINPNYLALQSDMDRMVYAVKLSRQIAATKAMSGWVKQELAPGPDVKTDADIAAFLRKKADSYHHQCGSCKMGSDFMAVVDPNLRVFGVEGLRVADASVMPTLTSGNIHAAVCVIAEKAADIMLKAN